MTIAIGHHRPARPRRSEPGFVLVEVLLSLAILAFALSACLRSYTQSLAATERSEAITQAIFLANRLLEDIEINPPPRGDSEGDFGEEHPNFSYRIHVDYIEPRYRKLPKAADQIDQFFMERHVELEVIYRKTAGNPFRALHMVTSIVGFEKFSGATKQAYYLY